MLRKGGLAERGDHPSSSDTDRSFHSESSFRIRMRLALLIARRTVVSLDYLLSMSGSRAMVSSFLLVVALRPAQVFCTSGLKIFDSRTACDSLTTRAWSSDVKAIQACRNFASLTMHLIDDVDLTVRRDSQSSLQVSGPVTPLGQSSLEIGASYAEPSCRSLVSIALPAPTSCLLQSCLLRLCSCPMSLPGRREVHFICMKLLKF